MQVNHEILDAFLRLRHEPSWALIVDAVKRDREEKVQQLVNASALNEYQRGMLAGRVAEIDELLRLTATTAADLAAFHTQ